MTMLETTTLADMLPGGIEASERRGQRNLLESTVLPSDMGDDRAVLEAMGVKFGALVDGDPLFINATLPEGWHRKGTGHALHSEVLDANGRKRIHVTYKAAFYDRYARMYPVRRFSFTAYEDRGDLRTGRVRDGDGTLLFETPPMREDKEKPWKTTEALDAQCVAWLDNHWPQWCDVTAYWD